MSRKYQVFQHVGEPAGDYGSAWKRLGHSYNLEAARALADSCPSRAVVMTQGKTLGLHVCDNGKPKRRKP